MKNRLLFTLLIVFFSFTVIGQTLTELVVPKYFGSKTAASTNNARTAFAICLKIDGLVPNTSYNIKSGIGLTTDAATSFGAGNTWDFNTSAWNGTSPILNVFTTDAGGSSGPFWLFLQPTGNGSRFDGGQTHNLRIGYAINGNSMPGSPNFIGTKIMTALDIANTPRTPVTTDDGAFIKGTADVTAGAKYVLLYDNVAGTGDPLFSYMIRQAIPTQASNSELPTPINDVYMQTGTSAIGDYPAVIPIGANNPNGVRRIEGRNADNTIFAFNTDSDGIWPSGANTTTATRRQVIYITITDAPLVPLIITTSPVTAITTTTATGGGNIVSDGGSTITARGICWSTLPNPTIAGNHTTEPGTTGSFTSYMTGLTPSTTYHVRAYAINGIGTTYGNDVSFSTLCEPNAPIPNFWAGSTNILAGQSINFFDSTLFCPVSWSWSFVGGIPYSSTLQNPTGIAYDFPGVYNVCLTVTNANGTNTLCKSNYITVNAPLNSKMVVTEIMYNPPETGIDSLEFIELYNNDTATVDLHGFYFSNPVSFTFPSYTVGPHSYVLVAKSASAMFHTFGVTALQWASGSLSNTGGLIRLKDRYNVTVDSVQYGAVMPWDTLANGRGPSLELCDPNSNNTLPSNWRHAIEFAAVNAAHDTIWASPGQGCSYPPVANFTASATHIHLNDFVQFADSSTGQVDTWNWEFEGGTPASSNLLIPPPVQYSSFGTYDVSLTVANIAGANVKVKTGYIVVGTTGTGTSGVKNSFVIYPNPTTGKFTVIFAGKDSHEVKIISGMGNTIVQKQSDGEFMEFDLSGFSKGIYVIQAFDNGTQTMISRKLVIQ